VRRPYRPLSHGPFAGAVDNPTSVFDAFAGSGLVFSGRRTDLV
jgi:hypothetical protein